MKNTIKFPGIIALIAVIGFSMAALSLTGCGGGDDGGGGDKLDLLANSGSWVKDDDSGRGIWFNKWLKTFGFSINSGHGNNGFGIYADALEAYDGTTVTVGGSLYSTPITSFTLILAGDKMTVSGIGQLYNSEVKSSIDYSEYNGTYTKQSE